MELRSTFKFTKGKSKTSFYFPLTIPSPRTFRQHYHVLSWPRSNSKRSNLCTEDTSKSCGCRHLVGPGTRNSMLSPVGIRHGCYHYCFSTIMNTADATTAVTTKFWSRPGVRHPARLFRCTSTFHPRSYSYPDAPMVLLRDKFLSQVGTMFHVYLAFVPVPFKAYAVDKGRERAFLLKPGNQSKK